MQYTSCIYLGRHTETVKNTSNTPLLMFVSRIFTISTIHFTFNYVTLVAVIAHLAFLDSRILVFSHSNSRILVSRILAFSYSRILILAFSYSCILILAFSYSRIVYCVHVQPKNQQNKCQTVDQLIENCVNQLKKWKVTVCNLYC